MSSILAQMHGAPQDWAEFGLAGLVIFALFCLTFFLLKNHKSERSEWASDARSREDVRVSQNERFIRVQEEFSSAIKELSESQKETLRLQREFREDTIRKQAIHEATLARQ